MIANRQGTGSSKIVVVLVVLFLGTFATGSCSTGGYSDPVESITFGTVLLEPSLPLFVAENQFFLSLDQSLIVAMEDEARWMIINNLTTEKQVPDFLDYIYMNGLEAVNPNAVDIIQ